jgi:hypothetical protein
MSDDILRFCTIYKKKLVYDIDICENPMNASDILYDYRDRINFVVSHTITAPGIQIMGPLYTHTITLDAEDLKYLYDKYSKGLSKELEDNIQQVHKLYANK